MFSEGRKEGATTKFGKLHIPFGLWINSPKKRLVKLGKRWPSAGSVKSTSSETASRTSEPPEPRLRARQPGPRHHRVSQIFGRWASERRLGEGEEEDGEEEGQEDEEEGELSTRPGAPGVLKVYGERISAGSNYKSVLATRASSARSLVREVLLRYGMGQEDPEEYLLCEAVGRGGRGGRGEAGEWRGECLRALAGGERPLVLQEMWRPRRGYSRRFEIRRREEVERGRREEEEEEEDVTEGINAQARRFGGRRCRLRSAQTPSPRDRGSLRRSISEANLNEQRRGRRKHVKSMVVLDRGAVGAEEGEEGAAPLTCEELAQTLVRPPSHTPYFLLLQGYSEQQDLLVHLMPGKTHTFGRTTTAPASEPPSSSSSPPPPPPDTPFSAPDLLPLHCRVRRSEEAGRSPAAYVRTCRGALVTLNGCPVPSEARLSPGDLLGLGRHVLLMYKDPRALPSLPSWLPSPGEGAAGLGRAFSCRLCGRCLRDDPAALEAYLSSREPALRYDPEDEEEEGALLEEIAARAGFRSDGEENEGGDGAFGLAPAYLFAVCVQQAADALEPRRLPALLLRIANLVKKVTWENIKEIGEKQPDSSQPQEAQEDPGTDVKDVISDLRPLMFWMANSIELLNFAQRKAAEVEGQEGFPDDASASVDLESCEEAMMLLDEVIMYTFQQCVYYITKTLYPALPALLDENPFAGDGGGPTVTPLGVERVLSVFRGALDLARRSLLHPDLLSQMFGYLFFFVNASLLNTLMERGERTPFYQWARAVQVRTNLDLVLDWLQTAGLGDIAGHHLRRLSAAVNLLCVPKTSLLKMSWSSLRQDHSALSAAQLLHLLQHYQLGPSRSRPPAWEPPPGEGEGAEKGEIFESFTEHPALILPSTNFCLSLSDPVPSEAFYAQLRHLRAFLWERAQQRLPANQRTPL